MTVFDRLGEQIAREQDALLARSNAQAEVRARLSELDVQALPRKLRNNQRRLAPAGVIGVLAVAAAVLLWTWTRVYNAEPLALAVRLTETRAELRVGEFVQAPGDHEAGLEFSDDSHIALARGGRARVMSLRASGADISLESGQASVSVRHRSDSSWHIGAGPFVVHVTGTRFDLGWKPDSDAFELTLHEGRVELSGCAFGTGYRVTAGQTVRASCRSEHFEVSGANSQHSDSAASPAAEGGKTAHAAEPGASQASQLELAAAPALKHVQATVATPAAVAPAREAIAPVAQETRVSADKLRGPTWQALARAGRYARALRTVRALGFEQECKQSNAEELSLLANVARYGQDSAGEAEALRWLRGRFQGTKRAAVAAFALGRLEFDNHAAYAEAAEWFRTYLREQPRGDLAREASGRLLEATHRMGDAASARDLAAHYLKDYPQGPHAALARGLTNAER